MTERVQSAVEQVNNSLLDRSANVAANRLDRAANAGLQTEPTDLKAG